MRFKEVTQAQKEQLPIDYNERSGFKWIFDTGGSGKGAWAGGFCHRLAGVALKEGFYPSVLIGASIGSFISMDLASGDQNVLYKSWSNWGRNVGVRVDMGFKERGFWGLYSFRKTVKEALKFILDRGTKRLIFHPANPIRVFIVSSRVNFRKNSSAGVVDLLKMFLQVATRKSKYKYIPDDIKYSLQLFHKGVELPRELSIPLDENNISDAVMASCLIPLIMGYPLSMDSRQLVDGGFVLKVPLSFRDWDPTGTIDKAASAAKTLVIVNNPEGIMWKTSMRQKAWNQEKWVQKALTTGTLIVAHPTKEIQASNLTRDSGLTMNIFRQGEKDAIAFLKRDDVRQFFEI